MGWVQGGGCKELGAKGWVQAGLVTGFGGLGCSIKEGSG